MPKDAGSGSRHGFHHHLSLPPPWTLESAGALPSLEPIKRSAIQPGPVLLRVLAKGSVPSPPEARATLIPRRCSVNSAAFRRVQHPAEPSPPVRGQALVDELT